MNDRTIIPIPLDSDLEAFASTQGRALGGTRVSYIRGLILAAKAAAESQAKHGRPMDDVDAAWLAHGIIPVKPDGIVTMKALRKARKGGAK